MRIPQLRAGAHRADERATDPRSAALLREVALRCRAGLVCTPNNGLTRREGCRAPRSCLHPKRRMHPSVALAAFLDAEVASLPTGILWIASQG